MGVNKESVTLNFVILSGCFPPPPKKPEKSLIDLDLYNCQLIIMINCPELGEKRLPYPHILLKCIFHHDSSISVFIINMNY